jgi:uncharacterized membrane protein
VAQQVGLSEKTRVEAFSDGVFAIAITLLILELRVPEDSGEHLWQALRHEWPSYLSYIISFTVIGIIWVNHHAVFSTVARIDRPLMFLNLLLLMTVVVIPFPTTLVADYVTEEDAGHIAVAVYSGVLLAMAVSFLLLVGWIIRAGLARYRLTPQQMRLVLVRFSVGISIYTFAIGLSFLDARVALGFHVVVALFYLVDQIVGPQEFASASNEGGA